MKDNFVYKNEYCCKPFTEVEIYGNGNVYTCCPGFFKEDYFIGNIFQVKSFDEIWYSEKAIQLRSFILNNNYTKCKTDICNKEYKNGVNYTEKADYPINVRFSYDPTCNIKCIYCRDKYYTIDNIEVWDKCINTILLPLIQQCKLLTISTIGEVSASKHGQSVIEKAIEVNPNIKFDILTNGILFNKDFINRLNLTERLERVAVTISATKEKTYKKIMRNSNFKNVLNNVEYLSSLKKSGKINELNLVFIVSVLNYKEIESFIKYTKENDARALIWEFRNKSDLEIEISKDYEKYAIWHKTHPCYNSFVKVISNINKKYDKNLYKLPDLFLNLEPISFKEQIMNRIRYYKNG